MCAQDSSSVRVNLTQAYLFDCRSPRAEDSLTAEGQRFYVDKIITRCEI
jgi:hypothetical protein